MHSLESTGRDPSPVANVHYPALDGLRGCAFLSVFIAHFVGMLRPNTWFAYGGWLGVDLFFVLSGFLITGILFDSLERPRYFKTFYIRRALRIFPLYYAPWIIFLLLTPWLHPLWTRFDLARIFYYANLMTFVAAHHPEIQAGGFMFYLPRGHLTGFNVGALWSLCLEEQFYLLWPLAVFIIRSREGLLRLCGFGIGASVLLNSGLCWWALKVHSDRGFLYEATYAHFSPMLFGAWLALWTRGREEGASVSSRVYLSLILTPLTLLIFGLVFIVKGFDLSHPFVPIAGYLLSGLMSSGFLLLALQKQSILKRFLTTPRLTGVGVISYGLYIFHGYLMGTFSHHLDLFNRNHIGPLMPPAAFATTYLLAYLSYKYFETPFLRLKDKLAPSRSVTVTGREPKPSTLATT